MLVTGRDFHPEKGKVHMWKKNTGGMGVFKSNKTSFLERFQTHPATTLRTHVSRDLDWMISTCAPSPTSLWFCDFELITSKLGVLVTPCDALRAGRVC